jgi:hypothetical protein
MPNLVRAVIGLIFAALAFAGAAILLLLVLPALAQLPGEGWHVLLTAIVAAPLLGVPMAALIFLLALVPALAFHIFAETNGWKHPYLYIGAGLILGVALTLTTKLACSSSSGDRMIGIALVSTGLVGGWVFWRWVVHPLRPDTDTV